MGRREDGKLLVCHCSSSQNNVVVTEFAASGFTALGAAGYFSVNARNSPQIEGSFDVFCVFLCKLLAFYAEVT